METIIINSFEHHGKILRTKVPIEFRVTRDNDLFEIMFPLCYSNFEGDNGVGHTIEDAIEDLSQWIHFLWKTYVDSLSSKDTVACFKFRDELLSLFELETT